MLSAVKRPAATPPLAFGAFSAGGSTVKRLLMHADDRAQVQAVALADALYVTDRSSDGRPVPPEGFVRFGELAAKDPRRVLLLTVSSSPNKSHPSGSETLGPLAEAIGKAVGLPVQQVSAADPRWAPLLQEIPVPWDKGYRIGHGAWLFDFGSKVKHGEHATVLAGPFWRHLVVPGMQGAEAAPAAASSASDGGPPRWLGFLAGVAVGASMVLAWRGRSSFGQ